MFDNGIYLNDFSFITHNTFIFYYNIALDETFNDTTDILLVFVVDIYYLIC